MNLFGPVHLAKGGHNFVTFCYTAVERQQKVFLDIFCGSSSTLFSAFVLSCTTCYMYSFFLIKTLYMCIEFDNTDYTGCLAVSILTAFKIQKSVSLACTIGEKIDQHLRTE